MKAIFSTLLLSCLFFACGGPEGVEAETGEAVADDPNTEVRTEASTQYLVDPTRSKIIWEGTKVIGGGHQGEIPVENGQLIVTNADKRLVAGQFAMDLRKMTNTDLPEEKAAQLIGHLQDGDFFEVEKYPMVNFDLKRIEPSESDEYTHELTGNLTMKGKVNAITIPATIEITNDQLIAKTPRFTIDRNDWGVSYNNSLTAPAKDAVISDDIGLEIELYANRD